MTASNNVTADTKTDPAVRQYLLAFADDEHLMGQHHTEWIGVAPFLEEDLAFSSIGQDELGHAAMLYAAVCELDGVEVDDQSIDGLAYRPDEEYQSCWFVESETTDWAEALVRHWIYDTVEFMRWKLLGDSSIAALAQIARVAEQEEEYHRLHADALLDMLLARPEARERILAAVASLLPLVSSLFDPVEAEAEVIARAIAAAPLSSLREPTEAAIAERFGIGEVDLHPSGVSSRSQRSEPFVSLMGRMREVIELDAAAIW